MADLSDRLWNVGEVYARTWRQAVRNPRRGRFSPVVQEPTGSPGKNAAAGARGRSCRNSGSWRRVYTRAAPLARESARHDFLARLAQVNWPGSPRSGLAADRLRALADSIYRGAGGPGGTVPRVPKRLALTTRQLQAGARSAALRLARLCVWRG
tara:strand:+ start:4972 stop:5433 length:462 start_codon:yes stop_codon:yes gene_type:complete